MTKGILQVALDHTGFAPPAFAPTTGADIPVPTVPFPAQVGPGLVSNPAAASGGVVSFTPEQWARVVESNASIAVAAAREATRAAAAPDPVGGPHGHDEVVDFDTGGEWSQLPEEVVSIADALPGVNLSEVNRIWKNKFEPLNLAKLHPESFEDPGASDAIVLVNGEIRSRRPKGELGDYPDLSTLLYY